MINITFEAHGTTFDTENHKSSGHFDVELSELGKKQANDLGERHKDDAFDVVFCSDLQRAYKTAEIAFGDKYPIIKDARLRECNYGDLNQADSNVVEGEKVNRIKVPFPNGESYEECAQRMKEFLEDIRKTYDGKKILIIGHRATQYGLEYYIKGKSLGELVSEKFKWQPGWEYTLN